MNQRAGLVALSCLIACAEESPEPDAIYQAAVDQLADEPGVAAGLGDVLSILRSMDVCAVLDRLGPGARFEDLRRLAFFAGGSASAGTAISLVGGVELVWDLHAHEAAVFTYGGQAALLRGLGVTAGGYLGLGAGLDRGVASWDGWFVAGGGGVSLPHDLVSTDAACFSSSPDGWSPDFDVVGCSLGLSLGLELLPTAGTVMVQRTHFERSAALGEILAFENRWLGARLGDGGVIHFERDGTVPGMPHTSRNLWLGLAVMNTLSAPGLVISPDIAALAIALGIARDFEDGGWGPVCD